MVMLLLWHQEENWHYCSQNWCNVFPTGIAVSGNIPGVCTEYYPRMCQYFMLRHPYIREDTTEHQFSWYNHEGRGVNTRQYEFFFKK